ncbi:energy transducer TonB [Pseudooceanicola sp.]|uniref:energy transducer TonB n=1 Tax=Pseudooceanicola sp. TaxID=1914328 RepID=UPI0040590EF9
MTRGTAIAKGAALTLAVVAHAAFLLIVPASEEVQIEGADGAAEVRLGNAFADMTAGTLSGARPAEPSRAAAAAPDVLAPLQAEAPPLTDTSEPLKATHPQQAAPAIAAPAIAAASADRAKTMSLPAPLDIAPAAESQALAPLAPTPGETHQAARPETSTTAPTTERLKGSTVVRSLRPRSRSAALEAAHQSRPAVTPTPRAKQAATPAPRAKPPKPTARKPGDATRNARAGEAAGKPETTARQSGIGGRQHAAGHAAASNYPGLIMRALSRAGKPSVDARGRAVVAFTIASNGGLSAVSLARSSGSSALDQAAVRLVRGAGPFPRPPEGARRNFSIQIKGR